MAVLGQAVAEGLSVEQALAAPALLLALKELPPVMARGVRGEEEGGHTALTFPAAPGAAAAAAAQPANGDARAPAAAPAAAQQIELAARRPAGGAGAAAAAAAAAAPSGMVLRGAVLDAVGQLAGCLGESGPLLEVVSSTVSRLAGPRDPATATLECCIAAAEALQGMPEEVGWPGRLGCFLRRAGLPPPPLSLPPLPAGNSGSACPRMRGREEA